MTANRDTILQKLSETEPVLVRLVSGLNDRQLDFRPEPDAWSTREILAHFVDDEMYVMRVRLERIIKEERPDLAPHDEKRWFADRNKTRDSLEHLLADFALQRSASLGMMRMLREEDWQRKGFQPEYGEFTAEQWIGHWLEHDTVHLRQIEHNLAQHSNH